ncbi:MAG: ribosome maturation factor RimP [Neisseriaceae bacterium]|nr:ribosome maturation factor RimP [Neisseriaceae bacterium]
MDLETLLDKTLSGLGYECVDVEMTSQGTLRVFIDQEGGITVDDCATVSHHLSHLFTVENVDYKRLEVSSPGLDRVLKKDRDFERFVGSTVRLETRLPVNGQKKFVGIIQSYEGGKLTLRIHKDKEETDLVLARENIDRARLKPEI